jgi:flagellar biosynthetic protein FlhB
MRQRALKRMIAEVLKADVVITNPDHYAVALKYEKEKMIAPQGIAILRTRFNSYKDKRGC